MIKNLFSQDRKQELIERAAWYEKEAVRAYNTDQTAKGDLFMFMADTARARAKETKYSHLMEKADHLNTLAIRCGDRRKADKLMARAYGLREKALKLSIGEALR